MKAVTRIGILVCLPAITGIANAQGFDLSICNDPTYNIFETVFHVRN